MNKGNNFWWWHNSVIPMVWIRLDPLLKWPSELLHLHPERGVAHEVDDDEEDEGEEDAAIAADLQMHDASATHLKAEDHRPQNQNQHQGRDHTSSLSQHLKQRSRPLYVYCLLMHRILIIDSSYKYTYSIIFH